MSSIVQHFLQLQSNALQQFRLLLLFHVLVVYTVFYGSSTCASKELYCKCHCTLKELSSVIEDSKKPTEHDYRSYLEIIPNAL